MTSDPRMQDYLRHMHEAALQIRQYIDGQDKGSFLADTRTQQAVLFNIVVLGEASAKLMDGYAEFILRHPEIPWRAVRNMRNQVAHGYFTIDMDVVWQTVTIALADLLQKLPGVLADANHQ